jgi:hypothetical protein
VIGKRTRNVASFGRAERGKQAVAAGHPEPEPTMVGRILVSEGAVPGKLGETPHVVQQGRDLGQQQVSRRELKRPPQPADGKANPLRVHLLELEHLVVFI